MPIRLELGAKDLEKGSVMAARRDTGAKEALPLSDLPTRIPRAAGADPSARYLRHPDQFQIGCLLILAGGKLVFESRCSPTCPRASPRCWSKCTHAPWAQGLPNRSCLLGCLRWELQVSCFLAMCSYGKVYWEVALASSALHGAAFAQQGGGV